MTLDFIRRGVCGFGAAAGLFGSFRSLQQALETQGLALYDGFFLWLTMFGGLLVACASAWIAFDDGGRPLSIQPEGRSFRFRSVPGPEANVTRHTSRQGA